MLAQDKSLLGLAEILAKASTTVHALLRFRSSCPGNLGRVKQKIKHKSEFAKTGKLVEQKLMYNLKNQIAKKIVENKQKEMIK